MKKILSTLFFLAIALIGFSQTQEVAIHEIISASAPQYKLKEENELQQVVLFKFKDGVSADSIKAMETDFKALTNQIKEVIKAEFGSNTSTNKLNQGFTHCFTTRFASEEDKTIYLTHPAHQAFIMKYMSIVDKMCGVSFWVNNAK